MIKKITENADYDHGHNHPTHLHVYKIKPHDFKSKPQGKVRYTGNYGDNAMADDAKLNEDVSMLERLRGMLNRADVSDDEIIGGIRLTEKGTQKVAARLGIAGSEVELMINSLVSKLRRERDIENGLDEDYSHESDYLKNVTVRDNDTGEEHFVRGSKGAKLVDRLNTHPEKSQTLLRRSVNESDTEIDDYESEIKENYGHGSYNFPWTYNGKSGTGTARFRGVGERIRVDVISVRDRYGREFEPDTKMMDSIQQQAFDFVGGA